MLKYLALLQREAEYFSKFPWSDEFSVSHYKKFPQILQM